MSAIVMTVETYPGHGMYGNLFNDTQGSMWPEKLYDIYPRSFSAPQTVTIPIGTWMNFTTDCVSPRLLDREWDTYNCAAMSIAAILVQNHNFSLDHPSVREANEKLSFGDLRTFNATGVLRRIVGCASNSCGGHGMTADQKDLLKKEYGSCGDGIGELSPGSVDGDDLKVILDPLKSLCSLASRDIEADIAGPGIIVSYILQLIFCAWFFILGTIIPHEPSHSVFLWWVRVKRRLCARMRKRKQSEDVQLRSALSRLRSSRFSAALFSAIIEFQETQLFLTLALQLATMFMVVVNEELSTPMDLRAARTITSGQTLMSLLTQTIIQRRAMHWWYTLVLTAIVGGLGITIRVLIPSEEGLASLPSASGCGEYTASILGLCPGGGGRLRFRRDEAKAAFDYLILYAVTTVVLVADQLRHVPWVASKLERLREETTRAPMFLQKSVSVIWNLGWFVLSYFLFFSLGVNAVFIFFEVGDALNKREKWTFGQVVAVLPWAPVVAKYIYFNIFGIENGVGNRIDHHYKVVRDKGIPGTGHKQSDTRSSVGDEYISLRSVGGDSQRNLDPEATEWDRASPGDGGPDGDLGSRAYRTANL